MFILASIQAAIVAFLFLARHINCYMFTKLTYKKYIWKHDWEVNYVKYGEEGKPALLLIPGFGVGAFHYEKNIPELSKDFQIFSLDLLGQGSSWPLTPPSSDQDLCFSIQSWTDQIIYFINNIIQRPVHIGGNSLGGYLSVCVANNSPDIVKSVILLNATPFWAFLPPSDSKSRPNFIWNGTLPAPKSALSFGTLYYDNLRKESSVKSMLGLVYANPDAVDESLIKNIIQSASNPLGQEAFTSILFSPKHPYPFLDMILSINKPICLIYGKEDPWIVPYWAQQIKKTKPETDYYQISPAGHCPHHEAPIVVNSVIKRWINYQEGISYKDDSPWISTESSSNKDQEWIFNSIGEEGSPNIISDIPSELSHPKFILKKLDGRPTNFIEKILDSNVYLRDVLKIFNINI